MPASDFKELRGAHDATDRRKTVMGSRMLAGSLKSLTAALALPKKSFASFSRKSEHEPVSKPQLTGR
jgi:hypothetical protein